MQILKIYFFQNFFPSMLKLTKRLLDPFYLNVMNHGIVTDMDN